MSWRSHSLASNFELVPHQGKKRLIPSLVSESDKAIHWMEFVGHEGLKVSQQEVEYMAHSKKIKQARYSFFDSWSSLDRSESMDIVTPPVASSDSTFPFLSKTGLRLLLRHNYRLHFNPSHPPPPPQPRHTSLRRRKNKGRRGDHIEEKTRNMLEPRAGVPFLSESERYALAEKRLSRTCLSPSPDLA